MRAPHQSGTASTPATCEGGCHCGRVRFRVTADKIDVNARCLDGVDVAALTVHRFDGRQWEDAMRAQVLWR